MSTGGRFVSSALEIARLRDENDYLRLLLVLTLAQGRANRRQFLQVSKTLRKCLTMRKKIAVEK